MPPRARTGNWLWREIRPTFAALVWFAFGCSLLMYINDWSVPRPPAATEPKADTAEIDTLYTGSIIFSPDRGDFCWQRMIDNRTGRLWDKGYINCDEIASRSAKERQRGALSVLRMQAISREFHGNPN